MLICSNIKHVAKRTNNFYLTGRFAILQETVVCGLNMYSDDPEDDPSQAHQNSNKGDIVVIFMICW